MERSRPLFRVDPGWLFVLAGLALVLAAAVIPSERQLHELRVQLEELQHAERSNFAILGAYEGFLGDLDDRDPALLKRLAASQLNLIPQGETPLLMASTVNASVPEWIEATVEVEPFRASPPPDTLLAQWTDGRKRLWSIGAGGFLVFMGLLIGTGSDRRSQRATRGSNERDEKEAWADESIDAEEDDESSDSHGEDGACDDSEAALDEDSEGDCDSEGGNETDSGKPFAT